MKKVTIAVLLVLSLTLSSLTAFADEGNGYQHYDDDQKTDGSDITVYDEMALMDNSSDGILTICIDPGHGGSEPGSTLYDGGYEKDNNLKIALFLKEALEEYSGVTVVMTRTEDVKVSLGERAQIAAENNADLLISIHTDSAYSDQCRGISIFYPNDHYSKSISDAGYAVAVNISNELTALGLGIWQGITTRDIEEDDPDLEYESGQRAFTYPATDSDMALGIKIYESSIIPGYRYTLADYYGVIRSSKRLGVPAIIVEHGFGNNAEDFGQFMSTDEKLKALAQADARALAATYDLENYSIVQFEDGNWYCVRNGEVYSKTFIAQGTVNGEYGSWYVNNGMIDLSANGIISVDDQLFYFLEGALQSTFTGFLYNDQGTWYISNGKAYNTILGWQKINGIWYYKMPSGEMAAGWLKINGTWYFFRPDCSMATGWILDGSTWYFLKDSGAMATGWLKRGSTWYYLDPSGAMQTGWKKLDGTWYYFKSSGAMATGWINDGGTWYFMKDSGAMATGWLKRGSTWYYLGPSGAMQTGWKKLDGSWYYFESSGAMVTGWQNIDGTDYYFYPSGALK